uniref:Cell growth-regulating nucleolar protein n=1 Tax=Parasteatoda tepidariorum TaxID=114398 RepID=A0A2L2XZW8_PARTP
MVFFTCSECGQSVKKNQVEKHCSFQCRNCKSLSCMDCGTEFWGDDYKTHTKCVTEDEKYGGKNYTPKPSANKGEVKQEKWIEYIKNTIATKDLSGPLSELLQKVIEFPNIPRKQSKFQKFVENSLKVKNQKLISEAWGIFDQSNQTETADKSEITNGNKAQGKRPAEEPLVKDKSSNKKKCPDQESDDDEESESDSEDMEENENGSEKVEENGNDDKENEEDDEMDEESDSEDMEEEETDAKDSLSQDNLKGGKGKCHKCNESGHMARDCPGETSGNQGSGGKSCFKCGQEGHLSRECTESGGGGSGACFNCNEEGHQSRNCPKKKQDSRGSGACFNCNEEGHQSRNCPQKRQGGRASSGACYNCNEEGHQSRDCPQKRQGGRASSGACYNCNEEGHLSRDCPQKRNGGRASYGA